MDPNTTENLRANTEAVKDKVGAKMKDITMRSPAAALNDKLGTTLGSKGFFSSALQFAKLNSWVWGSAAAVGLVAYYFSNSLKKDKDVVHVEVKPKN